MRRKRRNSWSHFGMRKRDGVVAALPFLAWNERNEEDANANLRIDWHTLDLETHETSATLSTMPPKARKGGTAVAWRNLVYVLGGVCDRYRYSHTENGANSLFYFDSKHPKRGWRTAPPMLASRAFPVAVATQGKIYVFGGNQKHEDCFFEVFDISRNRWDLLPPPSSPDAVPRRFDTAVHLDSCRSRILVHFGSNDSLYAYYVDSGSWECLDQKFGRAPYISQLADNVLYCIFGSYEDDLDDSREYFLAYDVVDTKWLPVIWLSEFPFISPGHANLFHLGKGEFCLIRYNSPMDDVTYFECLKLSVSNDGGVIYATSEPESTIILPFQGYDSCQIFLF